MSMRKLKLDLEAVSVESFAAEGEETRVQRGTVEGQEAATFCKCNTNSCDAFDTTIRCDTFHCWEE
jgi:hypothetical protein